MTAYITTFSGRTINLASPSHKDIDIGDIAHALSLLCRFNGHCREFYSVAEHSVRVSILLEELAKDYPQEHEQQLCLMGLLHDAAEAYPPGDIAGPLKGLLREWGAEEGLEALDVQNMFDNAARTHFDLGEPFENAWALVELADRMLLTWEWRDVMGRPPDEKPGGIGKPHTEHKLWPWSSIDAEVRFLFRFQQLAPDRPMLEALRRIVPDPMAEPEKGGWRTQLNALVLRECDRVHRRSQGVVEAEAIQANINKLPVRRKGEEHPSAAEELRHRFGLVIKHDTAAPDGEAKKHKRKKKRKCEHQRLARNGQCLNCGKDIGKDLLIRTEPKRKRKKKKRRGYSAEDVKRMVAEAVEAQAVDSMSGPKRGAPGSSPDLAQPVPKQQKMTPTKAERAAMDDPDIREQESEKVKGGGGLGSAAYD